MIVVQKNAHSLVEKRHLIAVYKAYKCGCETAMDVIAIKSTEDTNAVVQSRWKV